MFENPFPGANLDHVELEHGYPPLQADGFHCSECNIKLIPYYVEIDGQKILSCYRHPGDGLLRDPRIRGLQNDPFGVMEEQTDCKEAIWIAQCQRCKQVDNAHEMDELENGLYQHYEPEECAGMTAR